VGGFGGGVRGRVPQINAILKVDVGASILQMHAILKIDAKKQQYQV
jgi:aspartyl aminopeptidase